jgi:hypothetical protein
MLTLAATREDHLVRPPQLPPAAARQVVRSLLNNGLVEEVSAPIEDAVYVWRTHEDETAVMLRTTEAGLAASGEVLAPAQTSSAPTLEAFTAQVTDFLHEEGWERWAASEDEAKLMIEDGLANGRSATLVADDIIAWLEEREGEQGEEDDDEDAAGAADTGTGAGDAPDAAPATRPP